MVKLFEPDLDLVFRALGDPLRRRFVMELTRGERSVGQLHALSEVSLVAVLKHVDALEQAGVIFTEKRSRTRYCRLTPDGLKGADDWLTQARRFWPQALAQLHDHLAKEEK